LLIEIGDGVSIDLSDERVRQRGLRVAIIGESGSGKSHLLGLICEQLISKGAQVVLVDPHSEHVGLAEAFRDSVAVVGGDAGDVPLAAEAAPVYAEMLGSGMSLVLDVMDAVLEGEAALASLIQPVLSSLYRSLSRSPRPVLLALEEAHLLAPQQVTRDTSRLVRTVGNIVTGGRKFGIHTAIATQRPALLNKTVLSQLWLRFFGRLTDRIDREAVRDYFKPGDPEVLKDPMLPPGTFYVWGLGPEVVRVRVRSERLAPHRGETVALEPIRRSEEAERSIQAFRERIEEMLRRREEERSELESLRRRIRELEDALEERERTIAELSLKADIAEAIRSGLAEQGAAEGMRRLVEMYEGRIRELESELELERAARRELESKLATYEKLREALSQIAKENPPQPYLTPMERRVLETLRKYRVLPEYKVASLSGTTLRSSAYREARNRLIRLGLIRKTRHGLEIA